MPASGQSPDSQPAVARRHGTSKKTSSPTGGANVGFTFVDQSEDLESVGQKRIVMASQRHAIRSHVMRSVRHKENLIGKKRPTGRESGRKDSTNSVLSISSNSTNRSDDSLPLSSRRGSTILSSLTAVSDNLDHRRSMMPAAPSERLDPFGTFPGQPSSHVVIEELARYCFSTFIPMTFPVEGQKKQETMRRYTHVMQSQIQRPATFFGMMAIVAAHRAIILGRHNDLKPSGKVHDDLLFDNDFKLMKHEAISATRIRISKHGMDESSVGAVFSLIGAASIVGNSNEALIHLQSMKQVLQGSDQVIDLASPEAHWIPLTDVKAALVLLSKPYYSLPWSPQPIPCALMMKITPERGSPLRELGLGFQLIDGLSLQIQELLLDAVRLCWFVQFNQGESGSFLEPADHEVLRRKTLELEYQTVVRLHQDRAVAMDDGAVRSPLERMIGLAIVGMISNTVTHVLPSAGVGRALTQHQVDATRLYQTSTDDSTMQERFCLVWIMMQYIQRAENQVEEKYFVDALAGVCRSVNIACWQSLESLMYKYLYMPVMQRKAWKHIYESAAAVDWSPKSGTSELLASHMMS